MTTAPMQLLYAALLLLMLLLGGVIITAHHQPASGLSIQVRDNRPVIVASRQSHIPVGATVLGIGVVGQPLLTVNASDFIEEPHFLPDYDALSNFYSRQSRMTDMLHQSKPLIIRVQSSPLALPKDYSITLSPKRRIRDLPVVFWFQLGVSSLGCVLGCWIWALRPRQLAARLFAVLNLAYPLFAFPAALYSTRDIALDGQLLQRLVALNTAGALLYGCALISLFLIYPKPLVAPKWLWGIVALFSIWWGLDTAAMLPNPRLGTDLPVTLQMLTAVGCMLAQWRMTRGDVHARITLRWFAAWILISCGLFVVLLQSSRLVNIALDLSQGYSFGFFLFANVGIAIGLRRYRLFNLDQWAFSILYWLSGVLLLMILDAALVFILSPILSLSLAVLICGLLWLPVRGWLQSKFLWQNRLSDHELCERLLHIGFAINHQQRLMQWQRTLQDMFDCLDIRHCTLDSEQVKIMQNGLELYVPAINDLPALTLSYPRQGRALFSEHDLKLVNNVARLVRQANDRRTAYDEGVRTERTRIARDLHDDLGARLLSSLYQSDIQQTHQLIRHAIADMRNIVSGLSGTALPLNTVLASLHQEINTRLQACHIILKWIDQVDEPALTLNYDFYKNYMSIMRELISNLIKYAAASRVCIELNYSDKRLMTKICDNGCGFGRTASAHSQVVPPGHDMPDDSYGLKNLETRVARYSGTLTIKAAEHGGTCAMLELPIYPNNP